jgi:hypothetical protein
MIYTSEKFRPPKVAFFSLAINYNIDGLNDYLLHLLVFDQAAAGIGYHGECLSM